MEVDKNIYAAVGFNFRVTSSDAGFGLEVLAGVSINKDAKRSQDVFTDFEPTQSDAAFQTISGITAKLITETYQELGTNSKQIKLHEIALSNIEGEMDFYQSYSESNENVPEKYNWIEPSDYFEKKLNNSGSSSLKKGYEKILQEKIKVPVSRYDNWSIKNNIKLVDLVWMDVQGAERDVLEGMGSKLVNVKYIWLEYGEIIYQDAMTREETIIFMNKNNFELIEFMSSTGSVGDLMFFNSLF